MTITPGGISGASPYDTWHDLRPHTNSFLYGGSPQLPAQYRMSGDGFTEVVGAIKTPPTTGNYNSVIWGNIGVVAARPLGGGADYLLTGAADGAASPKVHVATNGDLSCNYLPASLAQTVLTVYGRFPNTTFGGLTS
jgi:hypothetical protein